MACGRRGIFKILVFYQVTQSGIDVVRVLHGSRNIRALLDAEPDE